MNQTERLLNSVMDHIAATLEQPSDMRAWEQLLIYCPSAILLERDPSLAGAGEKGALHWAVERWNVEVANRPLKNVHRRSLDTTWRQVIRFFGGDDEALCGPRHDDLVCGLPSVAQLDAIAALANRFWRIHPREIQDLGITREQFYEREMRALFTTQADRIEALEAALREIVKWDDNGDQIAGDIARNALAPEQGK